MGDDRFEAAMIAGSFLFILFGAPLVLWVIEGMLIAGIFASGVWTVVMFYESPLINDLKAHYGLPPKNEQGEVK